VEMVDDHVDQFWRQSSVGLSSAMSILALQTRTIQERDGDGSQELFETSSMIRNKGLAALASPYG
jgi:hypothetical protein